jgi:hypothetical protein
MLLFFFVRIKYTPYNAKKPNFKEEKAMENTGKFKVVFDYDGVAPRGIEKILIEKMFIQVYNMYCEVVNPKLEEWNESYSGPNDGGEPGSEYDAYIRDKTNELIETTINKTWRNGKVPFGLKEFFVGEEVNFKGRFENGTTMWFHLKAA